MIWIDADACPNVIKEILYKAAKRTHIPMVFVANQLLRLPVIKSLSCVKVEPGFDVADAYIVKHVNTGDLVITADILLADHVIKAGAYALDPRGELYTLDNIKQRLAVRNLMENLRTHGEITGGPSGLSLRNRQQFANALDQYLTRKGKR